MNHLEAKRIVDSLGLTPGESLYTRAVSWREASYGAGFPGTNNMGAILAGPGWTGATFMHADSSPTPTGQRWEQRVFRSYPTPEAGFRDLINVLLKPNVRTAIATGGWRAAAQAQYLNRYYEGRHYDALPKDAVEGAPNIDDYTNWLLTGRDEILRATGEPDFLGLPVRPTSVPPSGGQHLVSGRAFTFLGASAAAGVYPRLAEGSRGPDVAWLQSALNLPLTGFYDAGTRLAVGAWQASRSLTIDGIAGPQTFRRLYAETQAK